MAELATRRPARENWIALVAFVLMAGWIAWLRWPAQTTPVWNVDEAITAAIGDEINAGGVPFRDATDLRAPLTYYFYAAVFAVAGSNNMAAIHLAHTGLVIATALLVLLLGRRLGTTAGAVWALGLYSCMACSLFNALDLFALHTEWPLAFCSAAGALLYLEGVRRARTGWLVAAGVGYGLAVLAKQPAALDFGAPLAIQAWRILAARGDRRREIGRTAALLAGFALPLLATAVYFAARGAWDDLVFYTWTYNTRYYVPEVPFGARFPTVRVPLLLLQHFAPTLLATLVAALAFIGWRLARDPAERRDENLAANLLAPLWLLGSLAATTLSGRGFEHYSVQIMAPACLVAGQLLGPLTMWTLTVTPRRNLRAATHALLAIVLGAMAAVQLRHTFIFRQAIKPHVDPAVPVAKLVRELTTREDRIFVWGFYADLYTLADRLPASRFVHGSFLTGLIPWTNLGRDTSYAIVPGAMDVLLRDLEKNRPRLIVDASQALNRRFMDYPPEKFPAFIAYLHEHYVEVDPGLTQPASWFRFFVRRAGPPLRQASEANPPTVRITDFIRDASGQDLAVVRGEDARTQLTRLDFGSAGGEVAVELPPAGEHVAFFPFTRGREIRAGALTADGRAGIAAATALRSVTEIPPGFELTFPGGTSPASDLVSLHVPQPVTLDGRQFWLCHASTNVAFPLPAGAGRLTISFGILPAAYERPPDATDGVEFAMRLERANGTWVQLHRRLLEPVTTAGDRGVQTLEVDLPAVAAGDRLVLITLPGPFQRSSYDWAFWSAPQVVTGAGR